MKPSDLRRCLHVSNCENKVNPKLCLYVLSVFLVLMRTVYLNSVTWLLLQECFEDLLILLLFLEFSKIRGPWACLVIRWYILYKYTHTFNKLTSHRNQQAGLPNASSDLWGQLGLTFFCREWFRYIQAEKGGQRALVSQSESPWHSLAHHMCTEVIELAVNFHLVGEIKEIKKSLCKYVHKNEGNGQRKL